MRSQRNFFKIWSGRWESNRTPNQFPGISRCYAALQQPASTDSNALAISEYRLPPSAASRISYLLAYQWIHLRGTWGTNPQPAPRLEQPCHDNQKGLLPYGPSHALHARPLADWKITTRALARPLKDCQCCCRPRGRPRAHLKRDSEETFAADLTW